jgi:hypothetical protein
MYKKMKKSPNYLLLMPVVAVVALLIGATLKISFSKTNIPVNTDVIVKAASGNVSPNQTSPTPMPDNQVPHYAPAMQTVSAKSIKMSVSNFSVENGHVFVDACYDMPGNNVWDINAATLQYGTKSTSDFSVREISISIGKNKNAKGARCLNLDFQVDPTGDFSNLNLTIGNIGMIAPQEGHECETYQARINDDVSVANSGIKVACEQSPSGSQIRVLAKPISITDDNANKIVFKAMNGEIDGNWKFSVNLK